MAFDSAVSHCNWLTDWRTHWPTNQSVLIEKLIIIVVTQTLNKFFAFYGTRRSITVFIRASHWSLSRSEDIQSTTSHSISLRSILILSYHIVLGLSSGLFPSGFPTKVLQAFLISSMRVTRSAHLFILDLINLTIFGEAYKLWSSSVCSILC